MKWGLWERAELLQSACAGCETLRWAAHQLSITGAWRIWVHMGVRLQEIVLQACLEKSMH